LVCEINLLSQIGFVVLVGLAAKNAILFPLVFYVFIRQLPGASIDPATAKLPKTVAET